MKIEMGESLLYSWLRHVKECRIVQTNWKASTTWNFENTKKMQEIMDKTGKYFEEKYGYMIYKKNSLSQLIKQAEIDVLGISFEDGGNMVYAVDVAFHEGGLNYKDHVNTLISVIKKSIRAVMCIYGYMDAQESEIIFATPKIGGSLYNELETTIHETNELLISMGLETKIRLIANEDFNETILKPILEVSRGESDTSELFMRSYTMVEMFSKDRKSVKNIIEMEESILPDATLKELKIGKLVQITMKYLFENELLSPEDINLMTEGEYSKKTFNSNIPVIKLVTSDSEIKELKVDSNNYSRYYAETISIYNKKYLLSSQWAEKLQRKYYENWLITKYK